MASKKQARKPKAKKLAAGRKPQAVKPLSRAYEPPDPC